MILDFEFERSPESKIANPKSKNAAALRVPLAGATAASEGAPARAAALDVTM